VLNLKLALALLCSLLLLVFTADRAFPPDLSRSRVLSLATKGRDGVLLDLLTARDGDYRLPASISDVSPNYLRVLLRTEDQRFWWNPGVDPLALLRAVGQLATHGHVVSGASTITMQVARLLAPHRHDLAGKILDMARAVQLTAHLSKRQILALYLTLAPYGGNIEGVRAASLIYFREEPDALTDAQAALLVALPRSPERLRPDRHLHAALTATRRVLAHAGLDPDFAVTDLTDLARHPVPALAPHLAERLRGEGAAGVVETTIDSRLQAAIDDLATDEGALLPPQADMAALVVDNRSRKILAYLGGARFWGPHGMVDMVRAARSPGSALKPFIYGIAMDDSLIVPDTLIEDTAMNLAGYAPRDFDGAFAGMVTAREALQQSYNLPAVQLLRAIRPGRFVAALRATGARIMLPAGAPASLPVALGGEGISMEDLAMLYVGLANSGLVAPLTFRPLALREDGAAVMTAHSAAQIGGILRGSPLPDGVAPTARPIGYKTGTSYGFRDAWAAGMSGDYTVVVWVGRVDGTPSPGTYGRATAAPLMYRIFSLLPPDRFTPVPTPEVQALGLRVFGAAGIGLRVSTREPKILFPPSGAILQLSPDNNPVSLEAAGGRPPYRWMVNGTMLPAAPIGMSMSWLPDGPGFAHISVIDRDEAAASEDVQIQ
jgi:penicillin-binding protein 1C